MIDLNDITGDGGPGKPVVVTPDDAEFQAWRAAQQTPTHDDVEFQAWKAQQAGSPTVPAGSSGTWGSEPAQASTGAHLLNTFSGIPGVERLEALAAQGASHVAPSMFGGQPISYEQSLGALRSATGAIDPKTAALEKFLGTLSLYPVLPKNPMKAGALLGGADQLLSADQKSAGDRAAGTVAGTAIGGLLGKATDVAATGLSAGTGVVADKLAQLGIPGMARFATPTLGAQQLATSATRTAADNIAYGAAKTEAAAAPQTAKLTATLLDPDIEPFAAVARSARRNAGANDAEVALDTYKLMSREQGGLMQRMKANGYDAKLDTQASNIALAKQQLMDAIKDVAPSYPGAVAQHATAKGEEAAMQQAADAAQAAFGGKHVVGKKLETKSLEAFMRDAQSYTPGQQNAATDAILGRLRENSMFARVPIAHLPLPFPSAALSRTGGLLRAVDPNALPLGKGLLLGAYGAMSP